MAKKAPGENGHTRLDEAMASLIQSQATMVQNQAAFLGRIADQEKVTAERFARIENDISAILRLLGEHSRLLAEHSRLLERLPEAIHDKIGFKPQ